MKLFFLAGIIVILSFNNCLSQEKAKQIADSLAELKDSQNNPYKNTLSWDFSNILHTVNVYAYNATPYFVYNGNTIVGQSYGYTLPSGFPASVYFRHRIVGSNKVRRDRFKYFRANLAVNYASYQNTDSAFSQLKTQTGLLSFGSPAYSNNYFTGSISLGSEWAYHMGRFQLYYALDFIGEYSSYNNFSGFALNTQTSSSFYYFGNTRILSIGLGLCGGVNYYVSQRFIVGVETAYIQRFRQSKNSLKETNTYTSAETNYQLPTVYEMSGSFIPLKAIKVGFNF